MDAVLEVPIPGGMSEDDLRHLREDIAVYLFRHAYLSTREAAEWLGLAYEEFRSLAALRGVPTLHYDAGDALREMERLGIPVP